MGFFNRRNRAEPGTHAAPAPAPANGQGHARRDHVRQPITMSRKPTFGQWLKHTWLDILTMIILGAIGLGVYHAQPAPTRSFAVNFTSDGEIVYPQFAYPLRKEIIPIWLAAFLAAMIPIVVILFVQIRVRSFWDVNNGIMGLLYSLITAAIFQVFIKWLIGGLRPHFLDVCKPDISLASNAPGVVGSGYNGAGYQSLYYTREICTGDLTEINDSLESMPSGHSTAAFAGFVYLYLYLNAKLKVFSNYHPAMWKLSAIYAPLLGACLIAGALTIDEFHNWYDILAGATIGTIMAFSSYRMCYAAIWDWRFNHIPLNRGMPFTYNGEGELLDATWTRKAGWGVGGAGGAGLGHEKNGHYGGHAATGSNGYNGTGNVGVPRRAVGGAAHGDHMV